MRAAVERAGYQRTCRRSHPANRGDDLRSCVRRVEKSLAKLPGVESTTSILPPSKPPCVLTPAMVGRDEFRRAVEKAGYGIGFGTRNSQWRDAERYSSLEADRASSEDKRRARQTRTAAVSTCAEVHREPGGGLLIMAGMFLPLPWPMERAYSRCSWSPRLCSSGRAGSSTRAHGWPPATSPPT